MTDSRSRRRFLGISALGLAGTFVPKLAQTADAATDGPMPSSGSAISVWVTSGDKRFASAPPLAWQPATETPTADHLRLNPNLRFQDILGFGAAFTDAACYTFNRLSSEAREQLFHELFHPSQMGLSVGRICVGASDYSTKVYSFDEGAPDPTLLRFSIDHDREYILPMLRQARQANPDLFLFSSPWSPPGWMKFSGTMLGGSMRKHYLPTYAQYYLKFLQGYAAEGIPVQALTSQNEVDTDQDGKMPACIWPQETEIEFIRDHLGPLLEGNGMPVKIWVLDHNYNLWGRAICTLGDTKLREYVNAVAWHGYYGTPDMMTKVQDAYPEVEMHWTEGGPDYTDPGYLTDWCKWAGTFSDVLGNWCRSITAWNLALDEQGRPNIGPFPCGGVVTINSQTREITRSGQYWAFAHYASVIRRGARRFDSQTTVANLQHVAIENPDGQQVLVVTNPGAAKTVEIRLASMAVSVALNPNSVTTLAWRQ
ncbi:MAG TPA: glycoside hydrolase family 30 beta sandwich domain-containing protein [Terriglobales bacterium]|jgi:glucosylceramidase|nr:glycoside hydrolase family 30 beta sandwich domain-containing protein [Terriglobales bacterium]